MKTILPLMLAASIPIAVWAQGPASGRLSGTQIVERWTDTRSEAGRSPTAMLARQYVDGYLAGVADATEGKAWCNRNAIKAHEVDAEVMWAIKDMPIEQTRQAIAAQIVVEVLAKRFPCEGSRK